MNVEFHAATADRWKDVEELFGSRGACGGCWCMWWRLPHAEYEAARGAKNRRALRDLVEGDAVPGVLAYVDNEPAGWCAVAPREAYRRLETSRILKPIDDRPAWSIVCLFLARPYRKRGLSVRLIEAARRFAAERGAEVVEGYPVAPSKGKTADTFVYHGVVSAFERAGFTVVAAPSATRRIVRWSATNPVGG